MQALFSTGAKVIRGEPLSRHTTLGVGGPAEWYAEAADVAQLRALRAAARAQGLPVLLLGEGSNLLVRDGGVAGLVLRLKGDFEAIAFEGRRVRAGAGAFLPALVRRCAEQGLGGIEPLVGVPGTVGGACVMNAGTRDLEIGRVVRRVEILDEDGRLQALDAEAIRFEYRRSSLAGRWLCFAELELQAKNKDDIMRTVQKFLEQRLKTQPVGTQNVGSIFKNPAGRFAAQLVESAGLKGFAVGGAQVSPKHANFIVNTGRATADDIESLIFAVQEKVRDQFGLVLEPEVKIVGRKA